MFDTLVKYFQDKEKEWESFCRRCGGCCGAFDDPCKHLQKDKESKYYCAIYDCRFGLRETVSGDKFYCVHITKLFNAHWKNDYLCGYKKNRLPLR